MKAHTKSWNVWPYDSKTGSTLNLEKIQLNVEMRKICFLANILDDRLFFKESYKRKHSRNRNSWR